MNSKRKKTRFRIFLNWLLWALLVQFILINTSAALYAYKLTHLKPLPENGETNRSANIFSKTWRLFTGPDFYKLPAGRTPPFRTIPVHLETKNGLVIEALYAGTDSAKRGTVALFHGLSGSKESVFDEAVAFREMGYNVLLVDARSHGNSEGPVTTIGYFESEEVSLACDWLKQQKEETVFLWGASMGAVQIIKAVSDYGLQPAGIIIESPFLSLQSHLKGRARILGFPSQPFAFLTTGWIGLEQGFNGYAFHTVRYARSIRCPVLEQYGEKDELVLRYETDDVFEAIPSANKRMVMYEGGRHESLLRRDPATWKREVRGFLKENAKAIF